MNFIENLPDLNNTLNSVLASLDEYSDIQTLRIAFSLLGKICFCWAGSQSSPVAAVVPVLPDTTKMSKYAAKQKETLRRSPLPGFDSFILERIVPLSFAVVLRPKFSVTDGQSTLVVNEVAMLHSNLYDILGVQYQEYLCNMYFPTLGCPLVLGREFASSLAEKDKKVTKKCILGVFTKLKKAKP